MQRRILAHLRKGITKDRAARAVGIDPASFYRWMAEGEKAKRGVYREFFEAVLVAEDQTFIRSMGVVHDSMGKNVDPGTRLNAAKFYLSHRHAREFSTRAEVTGADGAPLQVQADVTVRPLLSDEQLASLTPEQLSATLQALAAKLVP